MMLIVFDSYDGEIRSMLRKKDDKPLVSTVGLFQSTRSFYLRIFRLTNDQFAVVGAHSFLLNISRLNLKRHCLKSPRKEKTLLRSEGRFTCKWKNMGLIQWQSLYELWSQLNRS